MERRPLSLFVLLLLAIPMAWAVCFGWLPSELIDQHDNIQTGYIYKKQLAIAGGDWQQMIYWPGLLGGVLVHDVTGSLPVMQWMLSWGLSWVTTSNIMIFLLQACFGYFCARTALSLTRIIAPAPDRAPPFGAELITGLLFAFLPVLAWRVTHGHFAIVQGLFVLICMTTLLLDEISNRRSLFTILLSVITLAHTFQYNGFQTMYYSVIFGTPFVLAVLLTSPADSIPTNSMMSRGKWLILPVSVFGIAILFSAPKLYGILANALGSEAGRSANDTVIYSYTTATLSDWVSSIPWSAGFIPEDRPFGLHHEVNYPIGFAALMLVVATWNKQLLTLVGAILLSALLALIISMNLQPVSTWLASLIPMMESFRVPARAMLPVIVLLTILGASALLARLAVSEEAEPQRWLLAGLAIVAGFMVPVGATDIIIPLIAVILLVMRVRAQPLALASLAGLSFITGAALSGFGERIHTPIPPPFTAAELAEYRELAIEQSPGLDRPLTRTDPEVFIAELGVNTTFAVGLSSLPGYWFPPSRFSRLHAALKEGIYNPSSAVFYNHPQRPGHGALNRLYNVTTRLGADERGFSVQPLSEPAMGEAWFSSEIELFRDWPSLADQLRDASTVELQASAALLEEPLVTGTLAANPLACESASLGEITYGKQAFPISLDTDVKGSCLLTLSMNYSSILIVRNQDDEILETLPTYGALLGIMVDDVSKQIVISAEPRGFPGIGWSYLIACLALVLLLIFAAGLKPFRFMNVVP